jgi:hypothetical protein
LLNALIALGVVLLVAGVLAAFGRTAASGRTVQAGATATASPTTTVAPTTAVPTAATTTTTTVAPTTVAATAPPPPPPAVDAGHRAPVGTATYTFVDATRSTPPAQGDPGEVTRTLPTIVRYPEAGSRAGAPFPLIVFAHGYQSSPSVYSALLDAWAGAGYVVAAPSFPRATAGGPLDEDDLASQPGDLSFVITKVLALAGPGGPLAGVVDPTRVGVAGHSDGASTTDGIGYNSCCRDRRVQADAVMEGDEHTFAGGALSVAGSPPLLVIQADHDAFNPAPLGLQVYHDARSPKYLLWLVNAQHLEPYTSDLSHLGVVEAVTTSFFDRYLKGRVDGLAGMQRGAVPGLATLASG